MYAVKTPTNVLFVMFFAEQVIHLFSYHKIPNLPPLKLVKTSIQFFRHYGYNRSIFRVDKGGKLSISAEFMQLWIKHEVILEITEVYIYSINGEVKLPHKTINDMVRIQLLFHVKTGELWCFCYQYTNLIIFRLMNRRLGTATILWYKHKNIYYTIPFTDLVILGWKNYINKSKQEKMALNTHNNTDTCAFPPAIYPYSNLQNEYWFYTRYSNCTKVIIYFDPNTHRMKENFHCYINEHDLKLHLK